MKSSFLTLASVVAVAARAFAQGSLTIDTPAGVHVCEVTTLTWTGGSSPYQLTVVDTGNNVIESLGTVNGQSFDWKVNLASGTEVGVEVRDSTGTSALTAPFEIGDGPDSSCVGN